MRRKLQTLLLLLPLLTGGCMTHKLWTESALDEWNEPARQPNLRVFDARARNDFLVVYDEYSGRHDATRTRAYFLNQNLDRHIARRAPSFVNLSLTNQLMALPIYQVLASRSDEPARPFVTRSTNPEAFIIYFKASGPKEYHLPVYADNVGGYEREALTPLTVTIDVTVAGGFLGCVWLYEGAPGIAH